jgi:hypothetical protein
MSDHREPPMAVAMQWVARVFAASLMMVLPGLGGQWLDDRWNTKFVGAAGFVVGLVGGVVYLIAVTRQTEDARRIARRVSGGGASGGGDASKSAKHEATQEHMGPGPGAPEQ